MACLIPCISSDERLGGLAAGPTDALDEARWRLFLYEAVSWLLGVGPEETEGPLRRLYAVYVKLDKTRRGQVSSILTDVLWVIDLQHESGPVPGSSESVGQMTAEKQRLAGLLRAFLSAQLIPPNVAKERLDADLLEAAQAIYSASQFGKKQVRINTALFYRQQKFNLLREEPEGYAKLMDLLMDVGRIVVDSLPSVGAAVKDTFEQVVRLIGYFDLDPNKVLDVILDAWAFAQPAPAELLFVGLMRQLAYPLGTVASILGFKLGFLARREPVPPEAVEGVMLVTARLLKHGFLPLGQVIGYLSPSDEECGEEARKRASAILSASRRAGFAAVDPAATPKAADQPESAGIPTGLGYQDAKGQLLEAFWSSRNQKALLLASLIQVRALDSALVLLRHLPHLLVLNSALGRAVCGLVSESLEGHASPASLLGMLSTWLPREARANHILAMDPLLLTQICRACARWLDSAANHEPVLMLLLNYVLPPMALCSAHVGLACELWGVLERLPAVQRFGLYGQWRSVIYDCQDTGLGLVEVAMAKTLAINDTRRVMRRLAKENVKQLGRLLGKLTHANPAVVFPVILEQLQAYDNLIQPVVESMRFLTPLGYDVLLCTARAAGPL